MIPISQMRKPRLEGEVTGPRSQSWDKWPHVRSVKQEEHSILTPPPGA